MSAPTMTPETMLARYIEGANKVECTNAGWTGDQVAANLELLPPLLCARLKLLYLGANCMVVCPVVVCERFPRLVELSLRDNELRSLPPALGNLTRLKALFLFNNKLRSVPSTLTRLTKLTCLSLRVNAPLPERFQTVTRERHATQEFLGALGEHYGAVEAAHARCRRAAVCVLAARGRGMMRYVARELVVALARLVWSSRDQSGWTAAP